MKCLLGIKPELSNTASVICRLNFACDEMEPANKKKKIKIKIFFKVTLCLYSRYKDVSLCSKMGEKQNATSWFCVAVYTAAVVSA